jgi:hypothetical protein
MAINLRIIHAPDFIKVTPDGRIDLEKSKQHLKQVASAAAPLTDYEIIIDTREAQIEMSPADLWYLAAELSTLGETFFRKTAVLCPLERFDQAGFFALCAQNRGFRVSAFSSYEEAVEWLLASRTSTSNRRANSH